MNSGFADEDEAQQGDQNSLLSYTRKLTALRHSAKALDNEGDWTILQDADDIFIQGLRDWMVKDATGNDIALYHQVWQAGAILLPVQSVGVMGDERTYERAVALRAVTSTDAMTADWAHLPYEFMAKVSNDIINKVKGVNRVCYDISSKPPATIEWE